ncbi:MAG: hypothetical protein D6722_22175, partial [Bacteroidetes bacterium]
AEPGNYWYQHTLRQAYEAAGNYPQAIAVQREITRRFPDRVEAFLGLCELYVRNNQLPEALSVLDELDQRTGETEESARRRLLIQEQQGDQAGALETTARLIELNPFVQGYYEKRYHLLMEAGQEAAAIQTLEDLLASSPANGFAMLTLADYYKAQDDIEKSDEYLFLAFANPEVEVQGKLKIIQQMMDYVAGDPSLLPRMQRLASLLGEAHPGSSALFSVRGLLFSLEGRTDSARYYLREGVLAEPANIPLWLDLLQASRKALDFEALYEDASEALEFYPNQEQFLYYYALAGERSGRWAAAHNALRKILRLGTAEAALLHRAQGLMALVEQGRERPAEAEAALQAALAAAGDDPEVRAWQARYLRAGSEAQAAIQQALDKQPLRPEWVDIYAQILLQNGQAAQAVRTLEPLVREHPLPLLLEHYGDALWQAGQATEARTQWQRALDAGARFDLADKLQQE